MYSCDDTVYGACERAEREVFPVERTMTAFVKGKPGPFVSACIMIEKSKVLFVKKKIDG
jgi:hypothetical protein